MYAHTSFIDISIHTDILYPTECCFSQAGSIANQFSLLLLLELLFYGYTEHNYM